MRDRTDFLVFTWMLSLSVIAFVLNIEEAIKDEPDWLNLFFSFSLILCFIPYVIRAKNQLKKTKHLN